MHKIGRLDRIVTISRDPEGFSRSRTKGGSGKCPRRAEIRQRGAESVKNRGKHAG